MSAGSKRRRVKVARCGATKEYATHTAICLREPGHVGNHQTYNSWGPGAEWKAQPTR